MRLAILASHGGSTLQAVIDACEDKRLNARPALVISNNSKSGAMQRAANHNITTLHLSAKTHPEEALRDDAMLDGLKQAEVDWILLLGYMKKLGGKTLTQFQGRILNTHPALLPKFGGEGFYGTKVHEAVLAAGETETGATVHLVDTEYDTGPILAQVTVPILEGDNVEAVEARVKSAEQKLLIETLIELFSQRGVSNY